MPQGNLHSYATTSVPIGRSREQVEDLLVRVGATGFRWSHDLGAREILEAVITWEDRRVGFRIEVPYDDDEKYHKQAMRALYWYMKTKVEAIEFGLVDLRQEFLPYLLTESGDTVWAKVEQDVKLLPAGEHRADR